MTVLALRWRQSDPPVVTRWRGVDAAMLATIERAPEKPIAAVIGPPGLPGTGGGGGTPVVAIAIDLGSVGRRSGRFVVGGFAALTTGAPVMMIQAAGPYPGKGTRADEAEMDAIVAHASVTSPTTVTGYWQSKTRVRGNYTFNIQIEG